MTRGTQLGRTLSSFAIFAGACSAPPRHGTVATPTVLREAPTQSIHAVSNCVEMDRRVRVIGVNGGPGVSHDSMEPLTAVANGSLCVLLYDQRGTGLSPMPANGDLSIPSHVDDLETVVGSNESVIVVGASWGAIVASSYASTAPPAVVGVVLVNPAPLRWDHYEAAGSTFLEHWQMVRALNDVPVPARGTPGCASLSRSFPAYFHEPADAPPFPERIQCNDGVTRQTIEQMRGFDLLGGGKKIRMPVFLLRGEAERVIFGNLGAEDVVALVEPQFLEFHELPRCGHAAMWDCPEQVVGFVQDWADRVVRSHASPRIPRRNGVLAGAYREVDHPPKSALGSTPR
jgi:pimeloyl-ACP methyl ester carboxylesterase